MVNFQRTILKQQLFFLNTIANINIGYIVKEKEQVDAGKKLYDQAKKLDDIFKNETVQKFIGKWEIVWGPYISFSNVKDFFADTEQDISLMSNLWATDNTVYMAKLVERPANDTNKALPDYFIGVAGTNPASPYGWFVEDFDVENTVAWPPSFLNLNSPDVKNAKISQGTSIGLCRIWHMGSETMPPCSSSSLEVGYLPKSGQSIWEYIAQQVETNANIMVGGHSLGGALSPTLATALADKMTADGHQVKISAFPTAGPTPGNEDFANHIAAVLESYHAVYNTIDIVPQAWEIGALNNIPGFYGSCGFEGFPIQVGNRLVRRFIAWAMNKPSMTYTREPIPACSNFVVETWDNGCIDIDKETTIVKKDHEEVIETLRVSLPNSLGNMYLGLQAIHGIKADLVTIYGNNVKKEGFFIEHGKEVKEFLAFLLYAGKQHTIAYSSEFEKGFRIPTDVIKVYSDEIQSDSSTYYQDSIHSLKYLFNEVAEYYKKLT